MWVGDPDKGYGAGQPGGWMYDVLDHIEQSQIRQLGKRQKPVILKKIMLGTQVPLLPVSVFHCPSRRGVAPVAYLRWDPWKNALDSPLIKTGCFRGDYAVSTSGAFEDQIAIDADAYCDIAWAFDEEEGESGDFAEEVRIACSGISFSGSEISLKQVEDGASQTFMLGEKYLMVDDYQTGFSWGDDAAYYTGSDHDNQRWSEPNPSQDQVGLENPESWGSAHPSTFHMVMCDGSVQVINYDIDEDTRIYLGSRRDGQATDLGD